MKKLLYRKLYSLYQSSYLLFSTKNGPQNDQNLNNGIFDLESFFSLGAFTGYPVLPGVSASLSDGKREYREKQMITAMVMQSSSEHDLQKWLGGVAHMHGLFTFSAHAHKHLSAKASSISPLGATARWLRGQTLSATLLLVPRKVPQ